MSFSTISTTTRGFSGWSFPMLITRENKNWMGLLMAFVATVLYMTSNHIHLFPPQLLPMTEMDQAIPFIPETLWIYTSEYYLFITVYLLCKNIENLNRYVYSFLTLQTVSVLIFWLWPTTYPRDQFPLPADLDAFTRYAFTALRTADTPASCCPSLHVSSVYLSSFMFLGEQRKKFPFFFLWASAIAVTTLTTKQHYIIDVVTGLLMAVIVYWFYQTFVTMRPSALQLRFRGALPKGLQAKR